MTRTALYALCAGALTVTACDEEEISIHPAVSEIEAVEGAGKLITESDEPIVDPVEDEAEETLGQPVVAVIASLTLEEGHEVRFIEIAPGSLVVRESGRIGDHVPRIGREPATKSPAEIYGTLVPGGAIPEALAQHEAQRSSEALKPRALDLEPSLGDLAVDAEPSLGNFEQGWFRLTFCQFKGGLLQGECAQGWDWARLLNRLASRWLTTAMVGREGRVAARFNAFWLKCPAGDWCRYTRFFSDSISPGTWVQYRSYNPINYRFGAEIVGAGVSTQVSLASESLAIRID